MKVEVSVFQGTNEVWKGTSETPLEVGRQQDGELDSYGIQTTDSKKRLVIAPVSVRSIPRQALLVEIADHKQVRVTNIHSALPIYVGENAHPLMPGQQYETDDTLIIMLPEDRMLRMTAVQSDQDGPPSGPPAGGQESHFRTVQADKSTLSQESGTARLNKLLQADTGEQQARVAVDLVRSALTVVQESAGSDQFFDSAASTVATMIDLDRALVLLREGDQWRVRSCFQTGNDSSDADSSENLRHISRGLTEEVLRTGQTILHDAAHHQYDPRKSMLVLDRAVATPIFDENRNVIGAIYGDRQRGSGGGNEPIGDLEAALLEVMAGAVSSGIARQRQATIRSSLTQFFSQAVATRLEKDEDLLAGRDAEVTVLFCDIRGFSTIAERVGAQRTIQWINDVLTELSRCVIKTDGVLVDYIGDELMAMWGAPAEMPDHAARACRSAVEMLGMIDPLRSRWSEITPEAFSFGIGINTGIARVGNTGSKLKFKYGPLGNTVNVASRVEGMTKKFGVGAIITESTARAIGRTHLINGDHELAAAHDREPTCKQDTHPVHGREFDHRRLAVVRPVGIQEPIMLHELKASANDDWRSMARRYEAALEAFDESNLTEAARQLASLVYDHPDDNPSVVLLGRVVDALTRHEEKVDPVWNMVSK